MARGRPSGSTPDDRIEQPTSARPDDELVDPLKIASEGLEKVETSKNPGRVPAALDSEQVPPDPLAVLSLAMDEGEAPDDEERPRPRRSLLGRLARGRVSTGESRATVTGRAGGTSARDTVLDTAPDAARDEEPADEPRVTTWAEDFAEQTGTGEWPAVRPGDGVHEAAEATESDRIEADPVAAQVAEDLRLAAERAEADRIEADRVAAQRAEADRLEHLRVAESRSAAGRVAAAHERHAEEQRSAPREEERLLAAQAQQPSRPAAPATRSTASGAQAGVGEPIPRFVEFRQGSVLRYVFGALFVVFAVAAVIAIFRAVSADSSVVILAAVGLTLVAMVSWWALLSWTPPVVSISNGMLEVSRGATSRSWDLRDPATEITFRGRAASRSWKAILRTEGGRPVTVSARQVDPAQFVEIVEHYQSVGPEVEL